MSEDAPKKGGIEQAMMFYQEEFPNLHGQFLDALKDAYNFEVIGSRDTHVVTFKEGQTGSELRITVYLKIRRNNEAK